MSSFKSPPTSTVPRSSPFRRPASPASPSSNRPNTPPSTNRAGASPMTSPSKLKQSYTVSDEEEEESLIVTPTKSSAYTNTIASTANGIKDGTVPFQLNSPQPTRQLPSPPKPSQPFSPSTLKGYNDPLTRLPPPILHSLRESFSVLDPNSTGVITPSSVHETLQSLGFDTSTINILFPPGSSQSITLPQYLNQMASILVNLSPQQELLNAFSAFDDDDSGQIDVAEMKEALLNTQPDIGEQALMERDIDRAINGFTGRRILGKNNLGNSGVRGLRTPAATRKGGDVFRYQEFVGSVMGTALEQGQNGSGIRA